MAKKYSTDEVLAGSIIGGVAGFLLGTPSEENKRKLSLYSQYEDEFKYYMSVKEHFFEYMNNKDNFIKYQKSMDDMGKRKNKIDFLANILRFKLDHSAKGLLDEAIFSFLTGLPRMTIISCVMLLEYLAKKHNPKVEKFFDSINMLQEQKKISNADYHFLHGLRSERNFQVHEMPVMPNIDDAATMLNLTIKLIGKLL